MRLSEFILHRQDEILKEWDAFAESVAKGGAKEMTQPELRDHAAEILERVAEDLEEPQTEHERSEKSKGRKAREPGESAAEIHAEFRIEAGFSLEAMLTEYRALRASVLRIWRQELGGSDATAGETGERIEEMTRFNEAMDEAIAQSVSRYAKRTKERTDRFLGALGHEIRNPLGTVAMAAGALEARRRREGGVELEGELSAALARSVERIEALVGQLMDFARSEAGLGLKLSREPGDLARIVGDIAREEGQKRPGARFELDAPEPVRGEWDRGRIEQLTANLLGNAARHGDPSREIEARVWAEGDDAFLRVSNHGEPIPKEDWLRIFEPFARGAAASTAPGGRGKEMGLGLGLYVCREIAKAHGGEIWVSSEGADGAAFTVRLPKRAAR